MASDETVVKRSSFLCIFCYFFAAAAILLQRLRDLRPVYIARRVECVFVIALHKVVLDAERNRQMAQFWMPRLSVNS